MKTFDWTKWDRREIEGLKSAIVKVYTKNIKSVKKIKSELRTFDNTVLALSRLDHDGDIAYNDLVSALHLIAQTHVDTDLRAIAQRVEQEIGSALIKLTLDKDLYKAFIDYRDGNYILESKGKLVLNDEELFCLSKEKIYFMQKSDLSFARMGYDLPDAQFKVYKDKLDKLSILSNTFRNNINSYEDYILCNRSDLEGCSDRYIAGLTQIEPQDKSKPNKSKLYKITLAYPDSIPFMEQSHSRAKRKELADKLAAKAGKDNLKVLVDMIKLRQGVSAMLGYNNYIDYKVEDRMAKNNKNVQKLLNEVKTNIKDKARSDYKELESMSKKLGYTKLEYYDIAYVTDKLKEDKYKLNQEEIRNYFELNHVLEHMFGLFGSLFAFRTVELTTAECRSLNFKSWDKHIKVYKVLNNKRKYKLNHKPLAIDENGEEVLSYLILDLHPRAGKYSHAAAFNISEYNNRSIALVCNFAAPNAKKPSLLSIDEVETLYHEFGHATHFMLADTELPEHNGFHVAWDFVETPSQMLEEWIYEYSELSQLAKHHEDNKRMPQDLLNNIIASKKFMNGRQWMRQITLSQLDLDLHLGKNVKDGKTIPPHRYYEQLIEKNLTTLVSPQNLFPASFGHMDGYDAGYYSYLWAKVYAVDFYSKFSKARTLDEKGDNRYYRDGAHASEQEIGLRYRREILGAGSSRDEIVGAKAFLGRPMSDKAFIKSL